MALTIEARRRTKGDMVILRYAYTHKTRKYFATGIKIPITDFKEGVIQKPVRSSNPNAAHLNRMADLVYGKIMSIQSDLLRDDKEPTADLVYSLYNKTEVVEVEVYKDTTLSVAFERFLASEGYDAATEKLYRTLYTHLERCFGNFPLKGFSLDHWIKFRKYLSKEKKLSANTVCIRLAKFKHFLKFLKEEGADILIEKFPMPKEEIKQVMMDIVSLRKIEEFIPPTKTMEQVRDLCLFQCYTGLRVSDLMRLERSHIVSTEGFYQISMRALKTNKEQFIPLSSEALSILKKYDYRLPVLVEQYYNRMLKFLAIDAKLELELEWLAYDEHGKKYYKKEKIEKLISSHACCRTAVLYLERQGYYLPDIARILGKSIPTIMKYYYGRTTQNNIIESQKRIDKKQALFELRN